MRILALNCGSSSIKASVISLGDGLYEALASASVSALPDRPAGVIRLGEGPEEAFAVAAGAGYGEGTLALLDALASRGLLDGLEAAGHRVVHGGPRLTAPVLLSDEALAEIEAAGALAPLHNAPALEAIRAARSRLDRTPMVATFDTSFFAALPADASTYAIPAELRERFGIRRYGFHGLAHRYMWRRLVGLAGRDDLRAVTLQLGSGCSAAAIRSGKPADTSMGFTPLEGLVMATRSGDIDPAIPSFLAGEGGFSPEEVERILNERSGLLGLSGASGDIRRLLALEASGDAAATLALSVFCYRVRKYVGAYAAALGGLDALVFGGGVGENQPAVRERICAGFDWLGLSLDSTANARTRGRDAVISSTGSRVLCCGVAVDEARIIAEDARACLQGQEVRDGG
ncbi:MAG TPA: acetate/propionate family kinase [Dehalococcoidia bacterium]|nr:acetate/propionate family kinase [Dehalococcoidia bacterium]